MLLFKNQHINIIVVSYHRQNSLLKCVDSLLQFTKNATISIIDNSCGKINQTLQAIENRGIIIYRNDKNIGKSRGIMKWYKEIMKNDVTSHLITMDADIVVEEDWLIKFIIASTRIKNFGILAPVIKNKSHETFEFQLKNKLIMHRRNHKSHFHTSEIYKNDHIAGSLFYINKKFFEKVGGYTQTQLYGNEDGELCKSARKLNLFTGIITNNEVTHLNDDCDTGYREWKKFNIKGDVDGRGYWD